MTLRAALIPAFIVLLLPLTGGAAPELTREVVLQRIGAFDAAIPKKQLEGVADFLSDRVQITLSFPNGRERKEVKLTKAEYLNLTRAAWRAATPHMPKREYTRVHIDKDRRSVLVECRTKESVEQRGQVMTSVSQDRMVLELEGDTLRLVESYSRVGG